MKTVLAIDDDAVFLRMYQVHFAFHKKFIELMTAATGEEGIELARARRPDLILLDLEMRGMDGAEISRRLRSDPKTVTIPIVMVTSHTDGPKLRAAYYDYYISKPIKTEHIKLLLEKYLGIAA